MKKIVIIILLFSPIVFLNCSGARNVSETAQWEYNNGDPEGFEDLLKSDGTMIIYSSSIDMTVESPDSANQELVKVAKKYEGYVKQSGTHKTIIRVNSKFKQQALDEIYLLGKVTDKSIKGKDVSSEFTDLQIRLENAEKARKRYLELLEKAENVEAALKVEKELERLNEKIDLLKGKIKEMNHLVMYATITINLKERKKPGILGYVGLGLYHSVKWLFVRN